MKLSKTAGQNLLGYFFIGPALIGFSIFLVFPVAITLILSFTEWQFLAGIEGIRFVGLSNYKGMLKDEWFTASMANNFYYTLVTVPLTMSLALFCAIILNKYVFGKNIIRLFFFLPYISNIVAISIVWFIMYSDVGPITMLVRQIGIENPPYWLADKRWALPAIMLMSIWMNLGYTMIIYIAGLQNIPRDLYEACEIDGANSIQKLRNVTIPMLSPTTFFILITSVISSFRVFGQINIMTHGGPGTATSVLVYHIYTTAFRFYNMGYAAAMSWVLFIIIFIITILQWQGQRKWVNHI